MERRHLVRINRQHQAILAPDMSLPDVLIAGVVVRPLCEAWSHVGAVRVLPGVGMWSNKDIQLHRPRVRPCRLAETCNLTDFAPIGHIVERSGQEY